ncbi:hypothetical protein N7535_002321 [Penicillium sp. DV-2018c]|nr:hypothetical protein N7461_004438 [Penicillium sp. DV-2018c]KAJ5583701.1 hypothetical protein N7535_002321 [Penicillium sp. DV-2018c]
MMVRRQERWEWMERELEEIKEAHLEEVFTLKERIARLMQQIPPKRILESREWRKSMPRSGMS